MPPTVGQRLKHAREKRGLTLLDVAHTTKVPVPRLQDLEDDKLNTFGSLTYAKSFLRAYALMLEVNAEEVLTQIQQPPLGGVGDYRYLVESQGPWVKSNDELVHVAPMPVVTPGRSFGFATVVCIIFGLLIGGGVLANAFFIAKAPSPPAGDIPGISPGSADSMAFSARVPDGEQPLPLVVPKAQLVPENFDAVPPKAEAVR